MDLLASILMMIGLYSVNLRIMGGPNVPLINETTLFTLLQPDSVADYVMRPVILFVIVVIAKLGLDWFFATERGLAIRATDRKSTRLNSSHLVISYAVFCLKKKKNQHPQQSPSHLKRSTPGI